MFKELQVTDSFLGLNEVVRGCQERGMYDNCIKNSHVDKIRNSCGCLPLGLKMNKNVNLLVFIFFNLIIYHLQDSMCTQSKKNTCLLEMNCIECKRYKNIDSPYRKERD